MLCKGVCVDLACWIPVTLWFVRGTSRAMLVIQGKDGGSWSRNRCICIPGSTLLLMHTRAVCPSLLTLLQIEVRVLDYHDELQEQGNSAAQAQAAAAELRQQPSTQLDAELSKEPQQQRQTLQQQGCIDQ